MSILDEAELRRLEEAVKRVEDLTGGPIESVTTPNLGDFVRGAKMRIAELDGSGAIHLTEERKELAMKTAGVIAVIMEREAQLSLSEAAQFNAFLERDYFTRADFGDLEAFYSETWDKLSDEGKKEMSERLWEGIRRKEYEFIDLPDPVKKREAEWIYSQLTRPGELPEALRDIPEADREEFIAAHESGNSEAAHEMLNRESFAENLRSREKPSKTDREPSTSEDKAVEENNSDASQGLLPTAVHSPEELDTFQIGPK